MFKSYVLRELDSHSDLGSQYTSEAYEAKLKELNIHHSFSLSAGKIAHTTTLVLNRSTHHHSDLGSQYTSEAYEAKLKELNIHHSFSLSAGKIAHTTTLVLNRSTHQLRRKKCVCQKHMKVLKSLI